MSTAIDGWPAALFGFNTLQFNENELFAGTTWYVERYNLLCGNNRNYLQIS